WCCDRLGWRGGIGERWMRMRDRRGPLAALLLLAAYGAALLWSQLWLAEALGAPVQARMDPLFTPLLSINSWLLAWRSLMRAGSPHRLMDGQKDCFPSRGWWSATSSRCSP